MGNLSAKLSHEIEKDEKRKKIRAKFTREEFIIHKKTRYSLTSGNPEAIKTDLNFTSYGSFQVNRNLFICRGSH